MIYVEIKTWKKCWYIKNFFFYKLYYKSTIVMHFLGPYTFYFCQIMFNKIVKFCFQLKKM